MATNPKLIPNVVKLTKAQLDTIASGGTITKGDNSYTADTNTLYLTDDDSVILGSGAPTTSTVGYIGQLYLDTLNNNKLYICDTITEDTSTTPSTFTYTWTQLIRVTDTADNNVYGVIKLGDSASGFTNNAFVGLMLREPSINDIKQPRGGAATQQTILLENIAVAVKYALCGTDRIGYYGDVENTGTETNKKSISMTSSEKALAQNVLGVDTALQLKQNKILTYDNIQVGSWVSDNTYATDGYIYKATIVLPNVTSYMIPNVTYALNDSISGNYAPIAETFNGGIYIWSKVNAIITIPLITLTDAYDSSTPTSFDLDIGTFNIDTSNINISEFFGQGYMGVCRIPVENCNLAANTNYTISYLDGNGNILSSYTCQRDVAVQNEPSYVFAGESGNTLIVLGYNCDLSSGAGSYVEGYNAIWFLDTTTPATQANVNQFFSELKAIQIELA